jgi:hypothetical protein
MRVGEITIEDILKVLKPIWISKPETASRLRGRIEKVLGWATAMKYRSGENPADWDGALQQPTLVVAAKLRHLLLEKLPDGLGSL